jgi:large subunit ribosomal protein L15
MQLHQLQPKTPRKAAKRVGRGGKRGKTSGRGHKGQLARAGNKPRPEMRDIIKKLPKRRGYGKNRARTVNSGRTKAVAVNLAALEATFEAGAEVSPQSLIAAGLIATRGGKTPPVKILGTGTLTKKLSVVRCTASASAREQIEAQGGTITA